MTTRAKVNIGSLLLVAALAVAMVVAIVLWQPLSASSSSKEPVLYPESEVETQWAEAIARFPEALPASSSFPEKAPAFFYPEKSQPDEVHLFEDGLFDSFATSYWRCAWLQEVSRADASGDVDRAVSARAALERYATLPWSIADQPDFQDYQRTLAEMATRTGSSVEAVEFGIDCAIMKEGVDK